MLENARIRLAGATLLGSALPLMVVWPLVMGHPEANRTSPVPIPLAFSEGIILRQHAVPVRLPKQIPFMSSQPSLPGVLAIDAAPPITDQLLHLSQYHPKSLQTSSKLPAHMNQPGYFVMLGNGLPTAYQLPLVSQKAVGASGFGIIGTKTSLVHLSPGGVRIHLNAGVVATWYHGPKANGWPMDSLLVWQQNGDTYAIWSNSPTFIAFSNIKPDMIAMARSMVLGAPVNGIGQSTIQSRYFNDRHPTSKLAGVLVRQTLSVAPPGTPGYQSKDGVGWRVTRDASPVPAGSAPQYRSTVARPFPGLGPVERSLHQVTKIPVYLPTVTPYVNDHQRGWPLLLDTIDSGGYSVRMQLTTGRIPPNTPPIVDYFGLSGVLGEVAGGNQVTIPQSPLTAPSVTIKQLERPDWVSGHLVNSMYRGHVLLPDGRTLLVVSDIAGDGDHTHVYFHVDGVPFSVGDYHSLAFAVKMAASMAHLQEGT